MLNNAILFALACGVVALLYGGITASWILRQPDGNDRMREIAAAVQTGAKAYLNRQYTTIGIVGVVLFLVIGLVPGLGWTTACGFAIGLGSCDCVFERLLTCGDCGRDRLERIAREDEEQDEEYDQRPEHQSAGRRKESALCGFSAFGGVFLDQQKKWKHGFV